MRREGVGRCELPWDAEWSAGRLRGRGSQRMNGFGSAVACRRRRCEAATRRGAGTWPWRSVGRGSTSGAYDRKDFWPPLARIARMSTGCRAAPDAVHHRNGLCTPAGAPRRVRPCCRPLAADARTYAASRRAEARQPKPFTLAGVIDSGPTRCQVPPHHRCRLPIRSRTGREASATIAIRRWQRRGTICRAPPARSPPRLRRYDRLRGCQT